MNRRLASVFVFALLVSGVATLFVYHFVLTNVEAASRKPRATQKVLVAAHTLEVGTLIQDGDLRWQISAETPSGQFINDRQQAIGRGVIATIYEGETIASGRLAPMGAGAGLAAMIPVGKRAVALKIDEVVGLAGFVVPGMRVDVIIAGGNSDAGRNGIVSRTVLQNIEVLSAGKKIEKTAEGKPQDAQVVNLLVTPDQAEVLSLASSETKVQLVLRNPLDTKEEITHGTSVAALFGQEMAPTLARNVVQPRVMRPAPAPVPQPESPTVEVFSGVKRSEQRLETRP
jgi:pilus assembly protein CpaB